MTAEGVLGVIPLSGVVSPFLSSGNTAMLANFFVFAILLSISHHEKDAGLREHFERPVRRLSYGIPDVAQRFGPATQRSSSR